MGREEGMNKMLHSQYYMCSQSDGYICIPNIHVPYMYHTCTIHVPYMYIHVPYMYHTLHKK